ncbi:unnamed protein product [Hermetia illucens]|uniref:Uncharacterized protein n=1 Tax=Hermetia illucens TaxID=343691 RepID=A0A7R8V4K3_HERIL|nr:unnamed protein product [Hermetia illucens]
MTRRRSTQCNHSKCCIVEKPFLKRCRVEIASSGFELEEEYWILKLPCHMHLKDHIANFRKTATCINKPIRNIM